MLDKVRTAQNELSIQKKIIYTVLIFIFGIGMGLLSKVLDESAFNELPFLMQKLDITNFLGRFAVWIFIAVCISVYSNSAKRAAFNVLVFFVGMVGSYYLYSAFAAGFFPKNYALIWFCFTAVSPLLAFFCWYAKGKGWPAVCISGVIIGTLFSQAVFLFQGIRITHITEVAVWIASLLVLRRTPKEFAAQIGISIPIAILIQLILPYWGY